MERRSTKHGPVQDEQMAHETEGMVRGAPQPAHVEEWRQTEPVEGSVPPVRRTAGAYPEPASHDIELRSELARVLSRDMFPADRDTLLSRLADNDTPPELTDRVAQLPAGAHFAGRHEVLEALGPSAPETRE